MTRDGWQRVTKRTPCPVCDRPDWCLLADDGSAAICSRVESPKLVGTKNAGWLHRLTEKVDTRRFPIRRAIVSCSPARVVDCGKLAAEYAAAISQGQVELLAAELGVSELSLHRLGLGWDGEAYCFPMRGADGTVVGIRRRLPDGRKLSVRGGHEGLFLPTGLSTEGPLLVTEGPTDCAALLDLRFSAIGRPSCTGGTRIVCELCKGRPVVVVSDNDAPGLRGAVSLAATLRVYCPFVKFITPPDRTKDARSWLNRGATRADVQNLIDAAPESRLTISTRKVIR